MQDSANASRRSHLFRAALLFLIGATITGLFLADALTSFDQQIYAALAAMQSEGLTLFFANLTYLGGGTAFVPIGVCLLLLTFWRNLRLEAAFLLAALLGAELLNELAKGFFDRARPVGLNLIELPDSKSFPSGHAMVGTSFYVMLAYQIKSRFDHFSGKWIIASLYLLVAAISLSRVYLGVHYASDVLAGAVFGLSWYFVTRYFYEIAVMRWRTPSLQLASIKIR